MHRSKRPFKLEEIWRIRTRLEPERNWMYIALLNLAIDSKLRACDLLNLHIHDVCAQNVVLARGHCMQRKTGLNADCYGTHSMRRTKATLVYEKTKNIRAVQLLLGHSKLDNTIRYLGVELEDALTR
ncbi:hypothetical protein [Vibrio mediterranei]|uniref:hypothetical protein n=1 Tax=Vibrio mediterranei TaxID=689 RepID=UPI002283A708|nr:hypothetical protein [Vibrio mediterranei]MCY9856064.1 hypothetical protein [Vibrio mediterranei]